MNEAEHFSPDELSEHDREMLNTGEVNGLEEEEKTLSSVYLGSEFLRMKVRQEQQGQPFRVIFTDIDDTFFRAERQEESKRLGQTLQEQGYPLVAVTSGDYDGVLGRISSGELPPFQIIAIQSGTEIYVLHRDENNNYQYVPDGEFRKMIEESGYDRRRALQSAKDFLENSELAKLHEVTLYQSEVEEAYLRGEQANVPSFKIMLHFFASSLEEIDRLNEELNQYFPDESIVIHEEIKYNSRMQPGDTKKRYNLDIVPVTKAGAVNYITKLTGVEEGIVAGDSGNDVGMLVDSGSLTGVLVGGAKPELRTAIDKISPPRERGGSFRKVIDENGQLKVFYVERDPERLGPESIARASQILLRAERIARLSNKETQQ